MPRLEAYYHDGNTGNESTDRKDVANAEKLTSAIRQRMGNNEQITELRQQIHLSPENPMLWDGEVDE